jgi:protease-4
MRIIPRKPFKWLFFLVAIVTVAITVSSLFSTPTIEPGTYLSVDVSGEYHVAPPGNVLDQLVEDRRVLASLIDALDQAQTDDRIEGAIIKIHSIGMGWGRVREIRDAVARLRDSGKRVVAYIDSSTMGANKEYYLASVADDIFVPPAGAPMLTGLSSRYIFLGGMWNHANLEMQVEQIREFKSFGDQVGGLGMTEALREQANSLLDDINSEFLETISVARGLTVSEVQAIVDSCPATASDFVEAGLADDQLFIDQILVDLGDGERVDTVSLSEYNRQGVSELLGNEQPKIAIIYADGAIVSGKGGRRGLGGASIGSSSLVKAFRLAAEDDEIEAIVFRLNSPGGSPLGSDHVWRAIRIASEKKPVVASFADVAASGGYYMAAGADLIVAEPTTITGSIGVVLIRPNISNLLARFDIATESIGRGRYSTIADTAKPMTEEELSLVREQMESTYQLFLDRVSVGRQMTVEEVDALGGGRVWTGKQALEHGLIDELGGLDVAIRLAATEAGIADPDNISKIYLPERRPLLQELLSPLSRSAAYLPSGFEEFLDSVATYAPLESGVYALSSAIFQIR